MLKIRIIKVECRYDEEAKVWYVQESNLPGLTAEASTAERMQEKLKIVIPDLLQAHIELHDGKTRRAKAIPTRVNMQYQDQIPCYA